MGARAIRHSGIPAVTHAPLAAKAIRAQVGATGLPQTEPLPSCLSYPEADQWDAYRLGYVAEPGTSQTTGAAAGVSSVGGAADSRTCPRPAGPITTAAGWVFDPLPHLHPQPLPRSQPPRLGHDRQAAHAPCEPPTRRSTRRRTSRLRPRRTTGLSSAVRPDASRRHLDPVTYWVFERRSAMSATLPRR